VPDTPRRFRFRLRLSKKMSRSLLPARSGPQSLELDTRADLVGVCVCDGFGVRVVVERGALKSTMGLVPTVAPAATSGPPMAFAASWS